MKNTNNKSTGRLIDTLIRICFLLLIVVWCLTILLPFTSLVVWGSIIAVTFYPLFEWVSKRVKGNSKLASTIITVAALVLILVPSYLMMDSLVEGLKQLGDNFANRPVEIPPPTENVREIPLIGNSLYDTWELASKNIESVVNKYTPQIIALGKWMLDAVVGVGVGILQFVVSLIIAGVLLTNTEETEELATKFFNKLAGKARSEKIKKMTVVTIRNVAKGILGVSFIQFFLAGVGFILAGVPYAGLWALLVLIMAVIQLGPGLVMIPIIIYMYSVESSLIATLWTVYFIAVTLSDNILKPILLGKGAPVPMLIIFLGSIGGFITMGFIGLFVGAMVLSLGYNLFLGWVNNEPNIEKN